MTAGKPDVGNGSGEMSVGNDGGEMASGAEFFAIEGHGIYEKENHL